MCRPTEVPGQGNCVSSFCVSSPTSGRSFLAELVSELSHPPSPGHSFIPSLHRGYSLRQVWLYSSIFGSRFLGPTFHTFWAIIQASLRFPSTFLGRTWGPKPQRPIVNSLGVSRMAHGGGLIVSFYLIGVEEFLPRHKPFPRYGVWAHL